MTAPIRFSSFTFDPATGELTGPAGVVRLQPQPAQVLSLLLSRPGELVTREELKLAIWPDTVVEADQGLNYCVRQIRAALVAVWLAATAHATAGLRVAVLPLVSRDAAPEWIRSADQRLTEQLVAGLTNADSGIGVVGPATTARLAGDPRPHTLIGKELGVDFVLSGGVRADDSTLFVQIIRVKDGVHLYAFRRLAFDVDLDSLSAGVVAGAAARIRSK